VGLARVSWVVRARLLALALACACACSGRYPHAGSAARVLTATPGLPQVPRRCLVANHVHTIVSDIYSHAPGPANTRHAYSPEGLRAAIAAFERDGVDAIVLTDHNAIDAAFDPQVRSAGLAVIGGMEWTTRSGHALLIGFTATGPADAILPPAWRTRPTLADFHAMVDRTHARGGLVIIAHPRVPFRTWPEHTFAADGVEVWGLDHFFMRNRAAQRWWHERLVGGERLIALAGTDLHPGATIRSHRYPLNWVSAPRCDPPALLAGMRAGHVLLVRDGDAPVVMLGAETTGAIDFADAHAGDTVNLAGRETIDLQLRVLAGADTRLRVLGRAGLVLTRDVDGPDHSVRLLLRVRPGDFIRAELYAGRRLLALTNPLYFR
jgi:predicted metal-dependent phosphoesterase TrpH